jgi:DNA-nicking Smr family endonuclease
MKRPPVLDPPRLTRRPRVLSREEAELWESVAKQAKPLRKRSRLKAADREALGAEKTAGVGPAPVVPVLSSRPPPIVHKPATIVAAPPPLAALGRRERSQLSRGRRDIDARLDLHGMTQTRAHRVLLNFLHRAQDDGLTFVLVITGKGTTGSDSERGVLRRQVPHWLGAPELRGVVVGFEEAHIGHGGAGALYVRIRRAR